MTILNLPHAGPTVPCAADPRLDLLNGMLLIANGFFFTGGK